MFWQAESSGQAAGSYKPVDTGQLCAKMSQFDFQQLEETLKRIPFLLLALLLLGVTALLISCASESAETQKLYTDAKEQFDFIKKAFQTSGPERGEMMRKIIADKYDITVVENLRRYLKDAPSGKYSSMAKALLAEAENDQNLRNLGIIRPLTDAAGNPDQAKIDSVRREQTRGSKALPKDQFGR